MTPETLLELQKDLRLLNAIPSSGYGQVVISFRAGKIDKIEVNNQILVQR